MVFLGLKFKKNDLNFTKCEKNKIVSNCLAKCHKRLYVNI